MRLQPEVPAQSGISSETGIVHQLTSLSRGNSLDVQLTSDKIHLMEKTQIQSVVTQLQKERARLENELHGVTAALTTFGKVFLRGSKGSRRGEPAHHKKQKKKGLRAPPRERRGLPRPRGAASPHEKINVVLQFERSLTPPATNSANS